MSKFLSFLVCYNPSIRLDDSEQARNQNKYNPYDV